MSRLFPEATLTIIAYAHVETRAPCKGWAGPPDRTVMASSKRIPIGTRGHVRSCRAASPRSRPKSSRQTPASCRKRPRQWSDGRGFCHDLDSAPALRMSAPIQSLPRSCARAARGRDRRAGMLRWHARATVLACSRRASRAPALTLRRTRSNEGCSPLSVRTTELELRRSHPVQQVHRAFRCLDRLRVICHAQRDNRLTMIRVYVYHYTLPVASHRQQLAARPAGPAPLLRSNKVPPDRIHSQRACER